MTTVCMIDFTFQFKLYLVQDICLHALTTVVEPEFELKLSYGIII